MKAEIKSEETKVFEPIKLELTIESMNELVFLRACFNGSGCHDIVTALNKRTNNRFRDYVPFDAQEVYDNIKVLYEEKIKQGF